MIVELVHPDSDRNPRHWVRNDQAFAMMLRAGSIEWGSKRTALQKFNYAAGDLALCDRHQGEWVGLMNVQHLQLGVSDAALLASSDGAYGEVELRYSRKFADARLSAMVAAVHAEMLAGFPSGRLFLDSVEQAMAVALACADIPRRTRPSALAKDQGVGPCEDRKRVESRRDGRIGRVEHSPFRAHVSQVNGPDPASICSAPQAGARQSDVARSRCAGAGCGRCLRLQDPAALRTGLS
jgi:hypothetical protein